MSFEQHAKALFKKLGISAEKVESADFDVDAVFDGFRKDFKAVGLKDDLDNERRAGVTAGYNKAQKALIEKFGLDSAKYKELTTGQFEAILEDAAALVAANKEQPAADNSKIMEELKEAKALLDAANKEKKALAKQIEELPTKLEAAKREGLFAAKKQAILEKEYNTLKSYVKEDIALAGDVFFDALRTKHNVEVELTETGDPVVKVRAADGTLQTAMKSGTETYKSLAEFFTEKGIIPEGLKRAAPAPNNNGQQFQLRPNTPPEPSKDAVINPKFAEFASKIQK